MEDAFFQRGYQLFQVSKYKEAIYILQEGLRQNPEDYNSKSLLIKCFIEVDNYATAKELNELLITQYPNEDELFHNRSVIAWQEKRNDIALKSIDEAITLNPYEPNYFGYKGLMHLENKEYQKSLDCANEGLSLSPNNILCLNVRAQSLTKLKRKKEAQQTVSNTLNHDPEGSFSHASVGWVQLELGDHKKAMDHFKESLKNDPNSRYAQEGMLESIKAKNFIYRAYLRYAFWISNMETKNQWFFIIGIYVVYRFLLKVVQLSEYPFLVLLIIIPYMIFALGAWIIDPLSNMILLLHSYGKYLLSKEDRISGLIFFGGLLLSLISVLLFIISNISMFLLVSVSSLCAIIPLTRWTSLELKASRIVSISIGAIIVLVGLIGPIFTNNLEMLGIISILGLVAFTWIGNFLK